MNERDMPDLPPGTSVNGAIIEELVDRGGYGTVYRARDKLSGTLLALKFVPLHRAKQWAEREGTLAMYFQHKNLVRQVGFSYWPPVLPEFFCLKMLYVEGRPLDVWAWEENPDTLAVMGKMVGVVRGLAVVHDEKVVHRDVKEANILVRDEDGEPVLLDFGAAKREGQATITEGMFPPGTPNYRSPEAWRFGLEHWNERRVTYRPGKADDQYALGVVLYRLLTRRFPFEVAWDDEASVNAAINKEPLPPHIVNPNVPQVVSDVCMKLLEKTPEKRYPSVLELGKELTHLLARADASWRVPLHDGPRLPRRGHRGAAERKKKPEAAAPPVEPIPATPTPATVADVPVHAMALQALRRAVVWMAVLVGAALAGWWLAQRWQPEPPPVALSSPSQTLKWLPGQEVAPSWPPPEAEQAAAPPPAKQTPAVVASLVTRPKDDALKKQQAPSPQGDTKQKGTLSPMAKWCVGAAAAANMACPGAQVRPGPAPEACPAGAVETMTNTLGLAVEQTHTVRFPQWNIQNHPVPVREGSTSVELSGTWGKLKGGTVLQGRLYFGEGRIYGRFTEARTPTGDSYKVCLEMRQESKRGAEMEAGSGKDTANIFPVVDVMAVERFE
ncbi:MAG TPA: serine/threonine-protein kinase [Archangium sp.]|uniref:serine/threonine protein kinase n=1 Tax=Archangium sp. TaxID=1872627 RepID=UPI002E35BE58|nr:serine/threonine-protein kinase [Archangium sp.]HEX5746107.1 serine/threonine-protein kinase [Archangium sp.]